jgi:hypothetical protein
MLAHQIQNTTSPKLPPVIKFLSAVPISTANGGAAQRSQDARASAEVAGSSRTRPRLMPIMRKWENQKHTTDNADTR